MLDFVCSPNNKQRDRRERKRTQELQAKLEIEPSDSKTDERSRLRQKLRAKRIHHQVEYSLVIQQAEINKREEFETYRQALMKIDGSCQGLKDAFECLVKWSNEMYGNKIKV